MSDSLQVIALPKRYIPTCGIDSEDFFYYPEAFDLKKIGNLHYSGIATNALLGFFQDLISKQIFWTEIFNHNGYGIKEEGESYGLWSVSPTDDRLEHFIMGWGFQWHGWCGERKELVEAVKQALKDSPSNEQIESISRFYRFQEPFVPWWKKEINNA